MEKPLTYMSVCDGIGAAHEAAKPLNWTCVGASEIEPFPIAVVKARHPDVLHLGDMTKHHEWNIEHPDLICGGTPCQAFSVAGLRAGLADPRGNLALVFLGIVDQYRPKWVVWENVPGVLSSTSHEAADPGLPDLDGNNRPADGETFVDTYDADEDHAYACFLAGLQELGYGAFGRVLDAQYAGVPQRRRRVFVVGHLGDWRPAAAVLFEPHSLSGDSAPSREAGKGVAGTLAPRSSGGGGLGTDFDLAGGVLSVPEIAGTMKAQNESGGWSNSADHVAAGYMLPIVMAHGQSNAEVVSDGEPSLTCNHEAPIIAHAFKVRGGGNSTGERGGNTGATGGVGYMGQDECAFTLSTDQDQHVMVPSGFQSKASITQSMNPSNVMPTVDASKAEGLAVLTRYAVRRLTPLECERLQAFPDNYTRIPWRGKPEEECPDGPRYKAIGNSWCVKEAKKLFRKIDLVEQIMK